MKILRLLPSRSISTGINFRNRLTEQTEDLGKTGTFTRSTIDPKEVENLAKLNKTWWELGHGLLALHALNPLRIQFVRDGLANMGFKANSPSLPLEGVQILDVGCGGGILSEPLARIGAKVTGIDASPDLIATAIEHATSDSSLSANLHYVHTTIENFALENSNAYDAVIASEVVEHINDKELFLKSCASIVKPGGSIFLSTMNKTLPAWLGGIIAAERVLKLVPPGTHDWNKFISPTEVQRLLEMSGCKTKLIHGMFYNPLKNEWFWTTSTAINYALHAVKKEIR